MKIGERQEEIHVWGGCSPIVANAINAFSDQWHPFSAKSRRYNIHRLIQEVIDPAIGHYADQLPADHPAIGAADPPGFYTEMSLGELTKLVGFDVVDKSMRMALRRYLRQAERIGAHDQEFIATCESTLELIRRCEGKAPSRSKVADHESLNGQRRHWFCELCGNRSEFASFVEDKAWPETDPIASDALKLSTRYCAGHRPKIEGLWNADYKRAVRSKGCLDVEVDRLTRQSWDQAQPRSTSGNALIDRFTWHCIALERLYPDEKAALRDLAAEITEAHITDAKKEIVMLVADGMNQSEVARQLGVSRNAVSKALKSIPPRFRFDLLPGHPASPPSPQPSSACTA
jgi:DNA-binding CsgD family transcriptional regulator